MLGVLVFSQTGMRISLKQLIPCLVHSGDTHWGILFRFLRNSLLSLIFLSKLKKNDK